MKGLARAGLRVLGQLASPGPAPVPSRFDEAAARMLRGRQLAAYLWAIPHVQGKRLLEIGTNVGYGSRLLAPLCAGYLGVDLSFEHAAAAGRAAGIPVVQADGQSLPLGTAPFDAVLSFQVIEHVWEVDRFLREIRRVLRPGGIALLSTPQRRTRLFPRQIPWNEEHLREFDEISLARRLGGFFQEVRLHGLFGDEPATAVESRRLWSDPWSYYFDGPWARPVRALGRVVRGLRGRAASIREDLVERILSARDEEALAVHSSVRETGLESAQDLLALCRRGKGEEGGGAAFDGPAYWRERLAAKGGLTGTGTSYGSEAWQRWLYRGKIRAYRRLLHRAGVDVRGLGILDFGCGTGFFEDLWERMGASRADGVDVVPEVIERLRAAHPRRRYVCADLARDASGLERLAPPDLVTAIDVLYHIVDDGALLATLDPLLALLPPGGRFLFSDALAETETAPHVRFRSLNQWTQILGRFGLQVVDREPVFSVNNRYGPAAERAPRLAGAVQHLADLLVLRTAPWTAQNWAVLAERPEARSSRPGRS